MEALACMSPRACPACWHFSAGRCGLMAQLREAEPEGFARAPTVRLALA